VPLPQHDYCSLHRLCESLLQAVPLIDGCGLILCLCRLLNPTCAVLSSLAAALPFEVAIGMNGCVWVNSGSLRHTIVITTAITHAQHVSDEDVPAVVRRLLEHAA
jgi:exosome complex RNA-binding protein Rrp4